MVSKRLLGLVILSMLASMVFILNREYEFFSKLNALNFEYTSDKHLIKINSSDEEKRELQKYNRESQMLNGFREILEWCDDASRDAEPRRSSNYLLSPEQLSRKHSNMSSLVDKLSTVLIITNNFPWKQSIGLLQRLYQPFFAVTIFCGTWNETYYNFNAKYESFPPIMKPFKYIHMDESEMHAGYYSYRCISKARDLKLENIKGYYVMSDDTTFNIWTKNNISKPFASMLTPKLPPVWWLLDVGERAAERVYSLMKNKYSEDRRMNEVWGEFETGLLSRKIKSSADAHMLAYNGRMNSDFYYIPSSKLDFVADLWELFFEASLFLEIATSKTFHSFEYEVMSNDVYLWSIQRGQWQKHYNSKITMLHPVKFSVFGNMMEKRKIFCDNVVRTFQEQLYT